MAKSIKLREFSFKSVDSEIASYSLKIVKIHAEIEEINKRRMEEYRQSQERDRIYEAETEQFYKNIEETMKKAAKCMEEWAKICEEEKQSLY